MYPALYFMRNISKQLEQMASRKIAFLIFLIKGIFLRTRWSITFEKGPMQQAARIGKSLARKIRYMVLTGMLLYRENVLARQYFLRRITYLSLYLFAIVAILARIEASRHVGDRIEEDLKLLELFTEQARQVSKKNFRLLPSREECLNDDMMTLIIPDEKKTEKDVR
jgi:acyl-CoA dehydrogenase family protein 9